MGSRRDRERKRRQSNLYNVAASARTAFYGKSIQQSADLLCSVRACITHDAPPLDPLAHDVFFFSRASGAALHIGSCSALNELS